MSKLNTENIKWVISILERNSIYLSQGKGKTHFDMRDTIQRKGDGFTYCIGGLCYILKGGKTPFSSIVADTPDLYCEDLSRNYVAPFFGVSDEQATKIVYPSAELMILIGDNREWAIRMLENLLATGKVDWVSTRYAVADNCQTDNNNTTEEKESNNMTYISDFNTANLQMKDNSNGITFKLTVEHVVDDVALVSYSYSPSGKKYTFSINRYCDVVASSLMGLKNFVVSVVPKESFTLKTVKVNVNGIVSTMENSVGATRQQAKAFVGRSSTGIAVDVTTGKVYTKETI